MTIMLRFCLESKAPDIPYIVNTFLSRLNNLIVQKKKHQNAFTYGKASTMVQLFANIWQYLTAIKTKIYTLNMLL